MDRAPRSRDFGCEQNSVQNSLEPKLIKFVHKHMYIFKYKKYVSDNIKLS